METLILIYCQGSQMEHSRMLAARAGAPGCGVAAANRTAREASTGHGDPWGQWVDSDGPIYLPSHHLSTHGTISRLHQELQQLRLQRSAEARRHAAEAQRPSSE